MSFELRGFGFQWCIHMAAELGFEPRHTESESAVLPLHNSAIRFFRAEIIISQINRFVNSFFEIFVFGRKNRNFHVFSFRRGGFLDKGIEI